MRVGETVFWALLAAGVAMLATRMMCNCTWLTIVGGVGA